MLGLPNSDNQKNQAFHATPCNSRSFRQQIYKRTIQFLRTQFIIITYLFQETIDPFIRDSNMIPLLVVQRTHNRHEFQCPVFQRTNFRNRTLFPFVRNKTYSIAPNINKIYAHFNAGYLNITRKRVCCPPAPDFRYSSHTTFASGGRNERAFW